MERTKTIPDSPLDFLLLPVHVHKRISRRFSGLILALLFIGAFDFVFSWSTADAGLFDGSIFTITVRFLLFIVFALIIGAVDAFCVIWPMADFAKILAKRRGKYISSGIHVILMKSYALSHLLFVLPYAYLTFAGIDTEVNPVTWATGMKIGFSIAAALTEILPYIQMALLYRTLSVRSKLEAFSKVIVLVALWLWMQMTSAVISFVALWAHVFLLNIG